MQKSSQIRKKTTKEVINSVSPQIHLSASCAVSRNWDLEIAWQAQLTLTQECLLRDHTSLSQFEISFVKFCSAQPKHLLKFFFNEQSYFF